MPTTPPQSGDYKSGPVVIAGASGRSYAQLAIDGGLACHVVDLFGDRDTRKICGNPNVSVVEDYESLAKHLLNLQPVLLIAVGGFETRVDLLEKLPPTIRRAGSPTITMRNLVDHRQLSAVLERLGCEPFYSPAVALQRPGCHNWMVKRLDQCGGKAVGKISRDEIASIRFEHGEVLQREFFGPAMSAIYVAAWAQDVSTVRRMGVTEQLIGVTEWGASEFAWCGCVSEPAFSTALATSLDSIASGIAEEFGIVGAFGIDFIVEDDVCRPIDFNARLPASSEIVQRAFLTSENLIAVHLAACTGESEVSDATPHRKGPVFGNATLYCKSSNPIIFPESIVEQFPMACDADAEATAIADVPMANTVIQPGHPILTLLVSGCDQTAVKSRLHENAAKIYAELL